MRVLVATTAGAGHFSPLVPFARACREARHEVLVAAPRSFAPSVERQGFAFWACDDTPEEEWGAIMARLPSASREEAEALVVGEVFADLDARAVLPRMLAAIEEWQPDVVLRETAEFGSYLAAERHGVPQVQGAVGLAALEQRWLPVVAPPLDRLRRSLGLPPDEKGERLRIPAITLVPPSMEDPARSSTARARFRDPLVPQAGSLPDWWGANGDPLLYVTLGSVAGTIPMFAAALPALVDAVSDLRARVLVTTGEGFDPSTLGPLPPHVHVERWIPQADVLPETDAMVCHGGFNTVLGGFAAGVPMAVVPLFADQPENAGRVAAVGAGEVLGDFNDRDAVRDAVARLLGEPSYRQAAGRMADEIASLPPASAALPILEQVAAS